MLLAFKPLLHNPFLWKERKINSIIAMIVLLLIASLVVRYLPLNHSTLPHPERNIPCWVNLLLPYIVNMVYRNLKADKILSNSKYSIKIRSFTWLYQEKTLSL